MAAQARGEHVPRPHGLPESAPDRASVIEERAADEDSDPSRLAALADLRADVAEALSRLSPKQRAAVVLRDSFGLSYAEIARVASIPVGTAKCYVHRARASVKAHLEERALA